MSDPAIPRLLPINPRTLGAPKGYSHGMLAPAGGRLLFIAGQVAWDEEQNVVEGGFAAQFAQALRNVLAVVHQAGGKPRDVGQLTIFVTDHREYLAGLRQIGGSYRRLMGPHYPAMALVEVQALLEPAARVEIQGLAVIGGRE